MAATKRKLNGKEIITEKFDELGDLTIVCKGGSTDDSNAEYHFVVHSATLRLASPVWRAMLTGGWAESGKSTIEFKDDDPKALRLILKITHLQSRDLPKEMTFNVLRQLAVLSDKYDIAHLVRLYALAWIAACEETIPKFYREEDGEDWIFIAWVFKKKDIFTKLATHLCRHARIDAHNHLINAKGRVLGEGWPDGLIETIKSIRLKAVNKLLQEFDTAHAKVLSGICYCGSAKCRFLVLGSFIDALLKRGWGLNGPDKVILDSVEEFSVKLETISITAQNNAHGSDNLRELKNAVSQAKKDIHRADPLLEAHHKHFESENPGKIEGCLTATLKG